MEKGENEVESSSTHVNASQQKTEVIRLLKEGKLSSGEIAKRTGVSPPTVWAFKAHLTMGTYEVGKESGIKQNVDNRSPDAVRLDDFHSVTHAGQLQEKNIPLVGLKELIIDGPFKMPTDSITDKRLLEIKKKYRRAYEPWSDEEDELLLRSHEEKQNATLLAEALQRQPSAIKSRIRKLMGK